jgi:hypothetical protein
MTLGRFNNKGLLVATVIIVSTIYKVVAELFTVAFLVVKWGQGETEFVVIFIDGRFNMIGVSSHHKSLIGSVTVLQFSYRRLAVILLITLHGRRLKRRNHILAQTDIVKRGLVAGLSSRQSITR